MGSKTGGHADSIQEGGTSKVQGEVAIVGCWAKVGGGDRYGKRGTLTHTGILWGSREGKCV